MSDSGEGRVCCVLVRGTRPFAFRRPPPLPSWVREGSELRAEIQKRIPGCVFRQFEWDAAHNPESRQQAAENLASLLRQLGLRFSRLIVIGHSHGGNVAVDAAFMAPLVPVEIVTLNTTFLRIQSLEDSKARKMLRDAVGIVFLLSLVVVALLLYSVWHWDSSWFVVVGLLAVAVAYLWREKGDAALTVFAPSLAGDDPAKDFGVGAIRNGVRCLCISDRHDEVYGAIRNIKAWYDQMLDPHHGIDADIVGFSRGSRLRSIDLKTFVIGIATLLVIGPVTLTVAKVVPFPANVVFAVISASALVVALPFMATGVILTMSITVFFAAHLARLHGWPLLAVGFRRWLSVSIEANEVPRREAGSRLELFRIQRPFSSQFMALLTTPFLLGRPRTVGWFKSLAYDLFTVLINTGLCIFYLVAWSVAFTFARVHRRIYNDDHALAKICSWL